MPESAATPAGSDRLDAVAGAFADRLGERLGEQPSTWWLDGLVRTSVSAIPFAISNSRLGLVISFDSRCPTSPRAGVQPGDLWEAQQLRELLLKTGPHGARVAHDVDALGVGTGCRRGDWELGLGGSRDNIRVYLGPADHRQILQQADRLRHGGWLPPALNQATCDWLERLRPAVLPIALARTYAATILYKMYFTAVADMTPGRLDFILADEPRSIRDLACDFRDSVGSTGRRCSWSVTLDERGTLVDWKLEIIGASLAQAPILEMWPGLLDSTAWIEDVCQDAGAVSRLPVASLRVADGTPSATIYFAFD